MTKKKAKRIINLHKFIVEESKGKFSEMHIRLSFLTCFNLIEDDEKRIINAKIYRVVKDRIDKG